MTTNLRDIACCGQRLFINHVSQHRLLSFMMRTHAWRFKSEYNSNGNYADHYSIYFHNPVPNRYYCYDSFFRWDAERIGLVTSSAGTTACRTIPRSVVFFCIIIWYASSCTFLARSTRWQIISRLIGKGVISHAVTLIFHLIIAQSGSAKNLFHLLLTTRIAYFIILGQWVSSFQHNIRPYCILNTIDFWCYISNLSPDSRYYLSNTLNERF